jgi:hypothetical protein
MDGNHEAAGEMSAGAGGLSAYRPSRNGFVTLNEFTDTLQIHCSFQSGSDIPAAQRV